MRIKQDPEKSISFYILLIGFCFYCLQSSAQDNVTSIGERISLAGSWLLKLDSNALGIKENWEDSSFNEIVKLPGSLAENKKGNLVTTPTVEHLSQTRKYIGAAWYQKEIKIPASWKSKQLRLFIERTKVTQVWIDNQLIGKSAILSAPQIYNIKPLKPGKHKITIIVNNSPSLTPVGGSHALSEHTQTNWNGMIGKLYLEALNPIEIHQIKLTPNVKDKQVSVQLKLKNYQRQAQEVRIELKASTYNTLVKKTIEPLSLSVDLRKGDSLIYIDYPLGRDAQVWNEYTPTLYELSVNLSKGDRLLDNQVVSFGLREFKATGTQFTNNGEIVFLRGKNDVCIFPLTGYPSMETEDWRRLYRIAKSYGINHYRFHSYTPPRAAFEAADLEGIYIQSELPNWAHLKKGDSSRIAFLQKEGEAILDAYGNHPSFVMFSLGNELVGDREIHERMVEDLRGYDPRFLYAFGTNAFYDNPEPGSKDDFWVTMRTGKETETGEFDVRGSFATTEDRRNGMINSQAPSTRRNFSSAISGFDRPVIGHEIGQYQIYPDYREMNKYTGVLRPLNFGIFKSRLEEAGMADQALDFLNASGKFAALLYREEIEMAFRTPGFGGFQLLDLQDFPGQGTALVGLLNAFMESKGLITPEEFRQFNNDIVIQLLMDRYIWTNNEDFKADIQVVNYSPESILDQHLKWEVKDLNRNSDLIASGDLPVLANKGKINVQGSISFNLQKITKASKLQIELSIPSTTYRSVYPIWVYPAKPDLEIPKNVHVATELNEEVINLLHAGKRVILFPEHNDSIKSKSVGSQFIAEFWNWRIFKAAAERMNRPVSAGTLGMLTNPQHAIFKDFPTEAHSNWQWWSIMKIARPLILDRLSNEYRPIVQVIDNIDRNHKLGILFEFKLGEGKLLVCMADLRSRLEQPEVRQLYHSILRYASSDDFKPEHGIDINQLEQLL